METLPVFLPLSKHDSAVGWQVPDSNATVQHQRSNSGAFLFFGMIRLALLGLEYYSNLASLPLDSSGCPRANPGLLCQSTEVDDE